MFLRQIDLTTALRPSLYPDETLLFVQDAVGLYEGKFKIANYQNGHAYLTSHRACYVDNNEPRKYSVAVDLKDVDHPEYTARFLKSSPKITLYPKPPKRASLAIRSPVPSHASLNGATNSSPTTRSGTPARPSFTPATLSTATNVTWVCPICSFSNPVPSNFDPVIANAHTPIPPCLACGIKPPLVHVVKAAIASMSNRQGSATSDRAQVARSVEGTANPAPHVRTPNNYHTVDPAPTTFPCPRCTFHNHPSLLTCEICGASLVSIGDRRPQVEGQIIGRPESPGPSLPLLPVGDDLTESIKFSFRAGGEKAFFERLKGALVQRKWLLQSAPPVPKPNFDGMGRPSGRSDNSIEAHQLLSRPRIVGIAGLERRGFELRKNNEVVIGSAFEDLEALMTSAKEVIAMAERFAAQSNGGSNGSPAEASAILSESASAMGLVTTKDMLGTGSASESLYISELSRNLAEYLTDDARGMLRREGGIMSLVDLWAVFNRTRGGVELISPSDFEKAARMWDTLRLPIRLRQFKSGLLVVQGRDRTDEKTIASLLAWLQETHQVPAGEDVSWDWRLFGRGVTAQEAAERFGWSVGVATEELEMAEERGVLCREQGLDGIRFWENLLVQEWSTNNNDTNRMAGL
ncbi:Vacuolar protein-sorting-associated protein 36 [Elasticomyces elasticus]|nr:Vacuolar protein-sorting-associated protein 36 [Elasticomyces elasticus]